MVEKWVDGIITIIVLDIGHHRLNVNVDLMLLAAQINTTLITSLLD